MVLTTKLSSDLNIIQAFGKDPNSSKFAENVLSVVKDPRKLAHNLALDPLNLLTTPIERIFTVLEKLDQKVLNIKAKDPGQANLINDISKKLFEAIAIAISNRIDIMGKLPDLKGKLELIYKNEKDQGLKLAVELLEELRAIQGIKWARDGYTDFDKFAAKDKGVRAVFAKNFNSWGDFLDAAGDKFSNILSPEFLHQFRHEEVANQVVKFSRPRHHQTSSHLLRARAASAA